MKNKPHQPKFREKFFFFASGAIMSTPFPILFSSLISFFLMADLPSFTANLVSVAIVAPLFEEFAKVYPLFYRHGETEKSLLTLGFYTGLGFGIVEFFLYVTILGAPPLLRLPALLFHATNSTIAAYGVSKNQFLRYYLLAVGLHFLNNFSALYGNWWFVGGVLATVISYLTAAMLYQRATEKPLDRWVLR